MKNKEKGLSAMKNKKKKEKKESVGNLSAFTADSFLFAVVRIQFY